MIEQIQGCRLRVSPSEALRSDTGYENSQVKGKNQKVRL